MKLSSLVFMSLWVARCFATTFPVAEFYDDSFDSGWVHENVGVFETCVTARFAPGPIGGAGYFTTVIQGYPLQTVVTYRAYHYWAEALYVPLTNGSIATFDWDVWFQTSVGGHVLNLVVLQNNTVYMSPQGEAASSQNTFWQHHRAQIVPSTFRRVLGDGPELPDFSTCGAPVFFGYVNYNDSGIRADGANCPPGGCLLPGGVFSLSLFRLRVVPEQRFPFVKFERGSSNSLSFTWETAIGNAYELQFSADPANTNSWQPLLVRVAGGCSDSLTIRTDGLPRAFFRMRRL